MPISYYCQAGLNQHKPAVDQALSGLSLQAQSCNKDKQWPKQSIRQQQQMITEKPNLGTETPNLNRQAVLNYSAELSLKAITGWDQIKDSRVWDCAIELATTQPVYLKQQGNVEQMFFAIEETAKDTAMITTLDHEKSEANTVNLKANTVNLKANTVNPESNRVLLYSSADPQLAKLWQLMCPSQSQLAMTNINSSSKLSAKQVAATNKQATFVNSYWLTPSQAIIEPTLVDSIYPSAWKITGQSTVPAKSQLIESHLYWQQSQPIANFKEK